MEEGQDDRQSTVSRKKKGDLSIADKITRTLRVKNGGLGRKAPAGPAAPSPAPQQLPMPQSEEDLQEPSDAGSPFKAHDPEPSLAIFGGIGARDPTNEWNREHNPSRRSNSITEYPAGYRSRDSDVFNF